MNRNRARPFYTGFRTPPNETTNETRPVARSPLARGGSTDLTFRSRGGGSDSHNHSRQHVSHTRSDGTGLFVPTVGTDERLTGWSRSFGRWRLLRIASMRAGCVACHDHGTTLRGFLPGGWDHPVASDGTTRRVVPVVLSLSCSDAAKSSDLEAGADGIPGGQRD